MENTTAKLRNMASFNMFKENFLKDIPGKIDLKPCLVALIFNPNYQKEKKKLHVLIKIKAEKSLGG